MKGLLRRLSTAVIFVMVMLGGLYGGPISFVLLFAIITALCLWEFYGMTLRYTRSKRDNIRRGIGLAIGLIPFALVSILKLELVETSEEFVVFASLLFFPIIFSSFIYELYADAEKPFINVALMVLGMVYIGIPFALLDFIAFNDEGFRTDAILGLLLMTWTNDTGAYLVGSKIGKTKLFPRISPNKTWEGTIGGVLITFLLAFLLSLWLTDYSLGEWMVLAAIVVVFGSLGDLVESMLKRSLKIKDSGSMLPGHGGLLDRFDAFIFAIPYAAAYLLWVQ